MSHLRGPKASDIETLSHAHVCFTTGGKSGDFEKGVDSALGDDVTDLQKDTSLQVRSPIVGYLNLTKTMIGAGVLALPYAMNKAGWALGSILLVMSTIGAMTGILIIF